jgi:hypothetical protein
VVFSLGNGFCAVAAEFCTSHIGVTRDGSMSIGAMRTSAAKKRRSDLSPHFRDELRFNLSETGTTSRCNAEHDCSIFRDFPPPTWG